MIHSMFIKNIDQLDCAIWSPDQGIVGRSWAVDIFLDGVLDSNGFVYDFSLLKKLAKKILKGTMDHALIIPKDHPAIEMSFPGQDIEIDLGEWQYRGPKESVYLLQVPAVHKEGIARALETHINEALPDSVSGVRIELREEVVNEGTFFQYTHGITGHDGMCQRPFHGHRSIVKIHDNGQRDLNLEQYLCHEILKGSIHIISESQISKRTDEWIEFSYQASLGQYSGKVPADRARVIDGHTSIESITQFLYQILERKTSSSSSLSLECYEGIGKGSLIIPQS